MKCIVRRRCGHADLAARVGALLHASMKCSARRHCRRVRKQYLLTSTNVNSCAPSGSRAFIGQAIAIHEANLLIASLVHDYDLTVHGELDFEENLTLRPANLKFRFRRVD